MQRLTLMLLSTACLLGLAAPALASNSGVTAAVNQSARGTAPGGAARTIVIGDNVVTDEKIETDGAGLVQILLPDGTTFTVGPNSSLTIDKFVYDPNASTAQVTASLARGVFRFIGGRTSKTPDGVTLNTPVGTVGIRGAVVDMSFTPNGQKIKAQIDMLFGKEVTLSGQGGALQRLYQAGYSIIIGHDGGLQLVKTPPGSASNIQQLLASKPGAHGGASDTPTDDKVAGSDTHKTNSDLPPGQNTPGFIPPDLEAILLASIDLSDPHNQAVVLKGKPGHSPSAFSSGVVTVHDGEYGVSVPFVSDTDADANFFDLKHHHYHSWVDDAGISIANPVPDGGEPGEGQLLLGFNPDTATLVLPDGTTVPSPEVHSYASVGIRHFHPCQCDFLQWGEWKANVEVPGSEGREARLRGYWVNGNVDDELFNTIYPKLGRGNGVQATYQGDVVGTVVRDWGATYQAHGDLDLTYNLGSRTGEMNISNFDHRDFQADLNGLSGGAASFGGSGDFTQTINDSQRTNHLSATGAFASDGFDPAAGVIGNFSATSGDNWSASGIFAGARDTQQ